MELFDRFLNSQVWERLLGLMGLLPILFSGKFHKELKEHLFTFAILISIGVSLLTWGIINEFIVRPQNIEIEQYKTYIATLEKRLINYKQNFETLSLQVQRANVESYLADEKPRYIEAYEAQQYCSNQVTIVYYENPKRFQVQVGGGRPRIIEFEAPGSKECFIYKGDTYILNLLKITIDGACISVCKKR